jgi:hypothetical protein
MERHLRDHGRVATRTDADDRAGEREELLGVERAVMGGHSNARPTKRKKTKRKRGEEEMSKRPSCAETLYAM